MRTGKGTSGEFPPAVAGVSGRTEQVWQAHDHGGLAHEHNVIEGEPHDHRPESASRRPTAATRAAWVKRKKMPLWVRALEAWVEGQYPVGRHGYTEARAVVEQVILHYEQEAKLATLTDAQRAGFAEGHRAEGE